MNPLKAGEILQKGSIIEQHEIHIYKYTITQSLYAYRGQVYLVIDKNDRIIFFEELKEV